MDSFHEQERPIDPLLASPDYRAHDLRQGLGSA